MIFNEVEALKRDYTDKYVVVDAQRPELRRFVDLTGVVKTVNMNGRALVEFDGLENIGWYDIDLDFLTVIDQPLPKPEPAKPAAKPKPAAKEKATPAAAQPKAAGGGMSVDDILAAARGGEAPAKAKPAEKTKADAGPMSVEDVLAAARGKQAAPKSPEAAQKPAKKPEKAAESTPAAAADPAKMSVKDILAAARGQGASPAPAEEVAVPTEPETIPEEPAAEEPPAEEVAGSSAPDGPLPTDVDGIIAFCREHDG